MFEVSVFGFPLLVVLAAVLLCLKTAQMRLEVNRSHL